MFLGIVQVLSGTLTMLALLLHNSLAARFLRFDCTGLENRHAERLRGFESPPVRSISSSVP